MNPESLLIYAPCALFLLWIALIAAAVWYRPARRINRALKRQREEERVRRVRAWSAGKVVRV
jgi:hypothetical protein